MMKGFIRRQGARFAASLLAGSMVVHSAAGVAQTQPSLASAAVCEVVDVSAEEPVKSGDAMTSKVVVASCGQASKLLGTAQSYESAYNATSKGLAVVLRDPVSATVLLVTLSAKGFVQVEDFTRELARASGRFADEGLAATATIDLSAFASRGQVSVPLDSRAKAKSAKNVTERTSLFAARDEAASRATLDLSRYVIARDDMKN